MEGMVAYGLKALCGFPGSCQPFEDAIGARQRLGQQASLQDRVEQLKRACMIRFVMSRKPDSPRCTMLAQAVAMSAPDLLPANPAACQAGFSHTRSRLRAGADVPGVCQSMTKGSLPG